MWDQNESKSLYKSLVEIKKLFAVKYTSWALPFLAYLQALYVAAHHTPIFHDICMAVRLKRTTTSTHCSIRLQHLCCSFTIKWFCLNPSWIAVLKVGICFVFSWIKYKFGYIPPFWCLGLENLHTQNKLTYASMISCSLVGMVDSRLLARQNTLIFHWRLLGKTRYMMMSRAARWFLNISVCLFAFVFRTILSTASWPTVNA